MSSKQSEHEYGDNPTGKKIMQPRMAAKWRDAVGSCDHPERNESLINRTAFASSASLITSGAFYILACHIGNTEILDGLVDYIKIMPDKKCISLSKRLQRNCSAGRSTIKPWCVDATATRTL